MNPKTKRLIFIIGGAAAFCLLAVALAVVGLGALFNRVKSGITQDPLKARAMAQEMVDYQLPKGYSEQMGMDLLVYRMVFIGTDASVDHPLIFLAQFQQQNMDPQEMARQMEQAAQQQTGRNGVTLQLVETRTVTIRGQEVPLTVSEGADKNGVVFRQWLTVFKGKAGTVLVMVQGYADGWDETALEAFLASIK